ncbi:MAG: hypothetical protein JW832_00045 [Deltaproteobacteria bacterium]|nr:hypothetical protein [Deltaproteobacteria bacterium]
MKESVIKNIYIEFKEKKQFTLPAHLLPAQQGCNLLCWLQELLLYYEQIDQIVRPFDDLPPLRLSSQEGLGLTAQDMHRFIINDLNLIPPRTRRKLLEHAASHGSADDAWLHLLPMLAGLLPASSRETVIEDLSWRFSPVAEILVALTWVFMEREQLVPPRGVRLVCDRFPYYQWITENGRLSLWEPEQPLCRWERLAFDVYDEWQRQEKDRL